MMICSCESVNASMIACYARRRLIMQRGFTCPRVKCFRSHECERRSGLLRGRSPAVIQSLQQC
jgi:hypothetical protein